MRILDLTCGWRFPWFDPDNADAVFVDIREEVAPSVVADSRVLPFSDGVFDLVAFDPPHVNVGANSHMTKQYGHHTHEEIRDIVSRCAQEAWRVTGANGLMAFKWNDAGQGFGKMLGLMRPWWRPLFGHKMKGRGFGPSSTYWAMMQRASL